MTASCADHFASSSPTSMPSSGVRKLHARRLAHERVVVLQPQAERHEHLAGLDRELAFERRQLSDTPRDSRSRRARSSGRRTATTDSAARETRRRPWRATRRCPTALETRNVDRRVAAAEVAADGEPAAHDVAGPGACGLRRARARAPRSRCARTACRTRCVCRRRSGLTWQLLHFRPLSTARYGSARGERAARARAAASNAATTMSCDCVLHDVPLLSRAVA